MRYAAAAVNRFSPEIVALVLRIYMSLRARCEALSVSEIVARFFRTNRYVSWVCARLGEGLLTNNALREPYSGLVWR